MIRRRLKDVLLGALIAAFAIGGASTAFGKVSKESILVSYNNIKVMIDGKLLQTDKEPFIYNDTAYLPVRAVAEAAGKEVMWDGASNTVALVSPGSLQETGVYSRTNPAPVGAEQTIKVSGYYEEYTAAVSVLEVIRGEEALNMVMDANMFNRQPADGKEYIVVKARVAVNDVKENKAVSVSKYMFDCFSSGNTEYGRSFTVDPEPSLSGDIYAGGSIAGYMTFLADKDDSAPKIVFGRNFDGTGGIWFSIE